MAFQVLAIGDSIMWGQGNREDRKFVRLVRDWLRDERKKADVCLSSIAHSGAVAAARTTDAQPAKWGEVPDDAPSIHAQCEAGANGLAADDVDLVLVNGGINDISPFHIVVANPFDPNGEARVEAMTNEIFGGVVPALLERTLGRYPEREGRRPGLLPDRLDGVEGASSRAAHAAPADEGGRRERDRSVRRRARRRGDREADRGRKAAHGRSVRQVPCDLERAAPKISRRARRRERRAHRVRAARIHR
jgi:lysophospholipase L1-like esterase